LIASKIFSTMMYNSVQAIKDIAIKDIILLIDNGFLLFLIELYKPAKENKAKIMVKKPIIVDII
jgi:hypothetical protein